MILIFCLQSNKHWHENEPQAETSNEKMKLVFWLTDQKHFIHCNQAFIWCEFFLCVHLHMFTIIYVYVERTSALHYLCLCLRCATACYCSNIQLITFSDHLQQNYLASSLSVVILSLVFQCCCICHSPSQINCTGHMTIHILLQFELQSSNPNMDKKPNLIIKTRLRI